MNHVLIDVNRLLIERDRFLIPAGHRLIDVDRLLIEKDRFLIDCRRSPYEPAPMNRAYAAFRSQAKVHTAAAEKKSYFLTYWVSVKDFGVREARKAHRHPGAE